MKRKSLCTTACPIARTLDVIGDWWSLLIVGEAFFGKRRFNEFHKSLGLAKNILCTRLQKLVSHGIFAACPASDGSAYQEYALTEKGRQLYLVLVALQQWGEKFLSKKGEQDRLLVDRQSRRPVKPLQLRSQSGRRLGPEDLITISISDNK